MRILTQPLSKEEFKQYVNEDGMVSGLAVLATPDEMIGTSIDSWNDIFTEKIVTGVLLGYQHGLYWENVGTLTLDDTTYMILEVDADVDPEYVQDDNEGSFEEDVQECANNLEDYLDQEADGVVVTADGVEGIKVACLQIIRMVLSHFDYAQEKRDQIARMIDRQQEE